jgi:hypothetical protein
MRSSVPMLFALTIFRVRENEKGTVDVEKSDLEIRERTVIGKLPS